MSLNMNREAVVNAALAFSLCNDGVLEIDHTLGDGFVRKKAVKSVSGLGNCLPLPFQSQGSTMSIGGGDLALEITFQKYDEPSRACLIGNGKVVCAGEGPSLHEFRLVCDNLKASTPVPVAKAFVALRLG